VLNTMFKSKEKELETVSCQECKCLIYKKDASKVNFNFWDIYYCLAHKKPYSRVESTNGRFRQDGKTETHYYGEVEMNKDGTPIKKK
jgi:hypothetical protein